MKAALLLTAALLASGCRDEELSQVGTAVEETHHEESDAVDILFVVDSSGSMEEEQDTLRRGFNDFIAGLVAAESDFRIASISTDSGDGGRFHGGVLTKETVDLETSFAALVSVGLDGSSVEQGMLAVDQALVAPGAAADEFLRDGALLFIVFVSDEDDQSPESTDDFIERMLRIKGGDERLLKLNAVVGDVPGGCETANAGTRYLELVEATAGAFHSICDPDLGLLELGSFLARQRFNLDHEATGPVRLFVDNVEVEPAEDTWHLEGRSVVFAAALEPCAKVELKYRTLDDVDVAATDDTPLVVDASSTYCSSQARVGDLTPRQRSCASAPPDTLAALLALAVFARSRRRPTAPR